MGGLRARVGWLGGAGEYLLLPSETALEGRDGQTRRKQLLLNLSYFFFLAPRVPNHQFEEVTGELVKFTADVD